MLATCLQSSCNALWIHLASEAYTMESELMANCALFPCAWHWCYSQSVARSDAAALHVMILRHGKGGEDV